MGTFIFEDEGDCVGVFLILDAARVCVVTELEDFADTGQVESQRPLAVASEVEKARVVKLQRD